MIQVKSFGWAFVRRIWQENIVRHGWFDLIKREFVSENKLALIYNCNSVNDDLAKKDLFVPIPTIKERDIILDYLNIHGLLHLYTRFNTIQTKADYSDFLSYSDECGTWLHDSYFRYMKKVIENEMHNWIFDNRIEYATIEVPILNEDGYLPKINYVQRNLLCQRDENNIKSNMFYARASDNSVIPQKPRYLKRT